METQNRRGFLEEQTILTAFNTKLECFGEGGSLISAYTVAATTRWLLWCITFGAICVAANVFVKRDAATSKKNILGLYRNQCT